MRSESLSPKSHIAAKCRAGARFGFYIHLFVFIAVNVLLIAINYALTPGYKWFVWPLLGWGIGVLSHAAGIFLFPGMLKHMTEKELRKIKKEAE